MERGEGGREAGIQAIAVPQPKSYKYDRSVVMINEASVERLSLRETAVLSGAPEKSIRHELASRVVRAARSGRRRRFGPRDVVYFSLVNELPIDLDKGLRKELFELLASDRERAGRWRREAHRIVLEGTRVAARFVGERARKGEPVAVLLEDYPALSADDVEFARLFAALGRPPGRPRKKVEFLHG